MTLRTTLLLLLTLGLAASGVGATQERVSEALLGALRRDGIAIPFASFDGRRWASRWPVELRNVEIPISLDGVPDRWWGIDQPPRRMSIWRDGQRTGGVEITGITTNRFMCEPRVALRTDYKASEPVPPPFERPYPKDGLLVAGDLTVEAIRQVDPASPEGKTAVQLIVEEFNRQETTAARSFASWVHPFPEQQRRARPITLEAMYAAPGHEPGWTTYYVEVVRQYPPGPEDKDGCGLVTFAHGWLLQHPNEKFRTRISAKVAFCDRKGVAYMLPFGLIRANGRHYWVYQYSGFEEEWYEIAEPTPRGVDGHVAYRAGVCDI